MTEWDARAYRRVSALQQWLAEKSLAHLSLTGGERVLDVGCGDGRVTAEIAARLPNGWVCGADASHAMIRFARGAVPSAAPRNLTFVGADAAALPFAAAFDLVVSFNALHWVHDQAAALRGIAAALRPSGRALLRLVADGPRRSLEQVIEDTCRTAPWRAAFAGCRVPFVHPQPDAYAALAADCGLVVERLEVAQERWDFHTRQGFAAFADATFVEWTRRLPAERHRAFIDGVLDRYAQVQPLEPASVFAFYQMEAVLRRAA